MFAELVGQGKGRKQRITPPDHDHYVRTSLAEIATALAALTAEPHPLALGDSRGWSDGDTR